MAHMVLPPANSPYHGARRSNPRYQRKHCLRFPVVGFCFVSGFAGLNPKPLGFVGLDCVADPSFDLVNSLSISGS